MHSIGNDILYSFFPKASKFFTNATGKSNILITAPHGGGMMPLTIPNRTKGNRTRDAYTRRLTQRIIDGLDYEKPYYVYADIHRIKVDLNRTEKECCDGSKRALAVWDDWNRIISDYKRIIKIKYGKGLYVDIHSQDMNSMFHIGYGLSAREYNDRRTGFETDARSTLYGLADGDTQLEKEMMFGKGSMIKTFEALNLPVMIPTSDSEYLSGARGIRAFSDNVFGAIQIESPTKFLAKNMEYVAYAIEVAIESFHREFLK